MRCDRCGRPVHYGVVIRTNDRVYGKHRSNLQHKEEVWCPFCVQKVATELLLADPDLYDRFHTGYGPVHQRDSLSGKGEASSGTRPARTGPQLCAHSRDIAEGESRMVRGLVASLGDLER